MTNDESRVQEFEQFYEFEQSCGIGSPLSEERWTDWTIEDIKTYIKIDKWDELKNTSLTVSDEEALLILKEFAENVRPNEENSDILDDLFATINEMSISGVIKLKETKLKKTEVETAITCRGDYQTAYFFIDFWLPIHTRWSIAKKLQADGYNLKEFFIVESLSYLRPNSIYLFVYENYIKEVKEILAKGTVFPFDIPVNYFSIKSIEERGLIMIPQNYSTPQYNNKTPDLRYRCYEVLIKR
ncbi:MULTISPECIES: hypothetical protein [unclassified Microcoleus]|uniref:hypothetical protein n=1 Tax=unclassified Microcoleus TaxID=2642155 RepID=UPI002FD1F40E